MIEDKNPKRTPLSELGEFKLIDHLTKHFKINHKSTVKGIGDDAAVLYYGK
jgi:thiamine-monophosphate kinase